MTYVLRAWRKGELIETGDYGASDEHARERFREIVENWTQRFASIQWNVTVNAEPGPYPARSFPIASYQQPGGSGA